MNRLFQPRRAGVVAGILAVLCLVLGASQSWTPASAGPAGPSVFRPGPNVHIAPDRGTLERAFGPGYLGGIYPTTNMTYHNGVVQHTIKVYTIFWDPSGNIGQGYKDLVNQYFGDVGGTGFYNINTQYFDNVPNPNSPMLNNSSFGATWTDTSQPYPHAGSPTDPLFDADIRSEVDRAQTQNSWPAPGVSGAGDGIIYFVYTEKGIESCVDNTYDSCTGGVTLPPADPTKAGHYCAYHWWEGGAGAKIYANMPYDETWGTGCRAFTVSPNGDIAADTEVSTSSHEQFESATDPYGDAWYDTKTNGEDGDKCAYVYGSNDSKGDTNSQGQIQADGHNQVLNGHPYIIQLEWSNADLNASLPLSGCVSRFAANVDVAISKSASPSTVIAGNYLTYTIDVTNLDPTFEATDLLMQDPLPPTAFFQSLTAPAGWTCTTPAFNTSGLVACTALSLPKSTTAEFSILVQVAPDAPAGTLSNTATVSSTSGDSNPANDGATATTTVTSQADVAITKTESPDPVIAGNQLTYAITVTNNGPGSANGVVVSDPLPAGITFISATPPFTCTAGGGTVTCTLNTVAAGASVPITIQEQIPANFLSKIPASTKTITNTASVTTTSFDPTPSNNSASVQTTVIEQADLGVSKDCKPDPVTPVPAGTDAYCNIYVNNFGPSDAQNVTLTDVIISNGLFRVTSVAVVPSGTCAPTSTSNVSGVTISCNLGVEPAGGQTTVTVHFTADNAADVDDTATVAASTPDPVSTNNTAVGHVHFFSSADLSITKTASPNPVLAGNNVTYTITVANAGPSTAQNVVVTDNLPVQLTNVSVTSAGNTCNAGVPGSLPLTCNMGSIANGASEQITVVATVKPSTPNGTILFNNGSVSSDTSDPDNSNNAASVSTTVNTQADLLITMTSDASSYKPNTKITYHITMTNNGPSDAQSVLVTDTLPDPKQAIYLSDTGGCVFSAPKTLKCSIGTLAAGASRDFYIYATVKGARGTITNSATVSSATVDPITSNNTAVVTVTIAGKP